MKKVFVLLLTVSFFIVGTVSAGDKFESKQEEIGYAIGMNIGTSMRQQPLDIDTDQLVAGLRAVLKGEDTLITIDEMAQILTAFQQEMQMKQMAEAAAAAAKNEKLAQEFLAKNGKQDGVVTLDSGLQYKVIRAGEGATPQEESKVQVHYSGTLLDGTEFDSSYKRGEPASFPVNGVISGWTEALQLMKEGAKWQLVIPSQLAYAERGAPPMIPPNAALIFEVELLKIL
ncbi:MAG: FKBP-type peptidyl-prolyl cis-trans isomerase [Thermodesulfobacteriota bacterium]|nr:FKBP-type peptidyl-prolyl cis-trans isomerase [Thermodesulfobacteriota bacterium]